MKAAIKTEHEKLTQTRPEPRIFWDFIKRERDNLLKEYRFAAKQNVTVRPGTIHLNVGTGAQHSSGAQPPIYGHVMAEGPFAGEDPRDLVARAIRWWKDYLDRVDYAAGELN